MLYHPLFIPDCALWIIQSLHQVNQLKAWVLVFFHSHQSPEYWEHSRYPQYQQAAQRLRVVGLHHLDDPQQGFHPWPPEVAHVEALHVHQACPAAVYRHMLHDYEHAWTSLHFSSQKQNIHIPAPDWSTKDPGVFLTASQPLLVDGQNLSQV